MIRDFTDETKSIIEEAISESLNAQAVYSGHGYTYESELEATVSIMGQDYVMNLSEIESSAEVAASHMRGYITKSEIMYWTIDRIFNTVRDVDYNTSVSVASETENVSSIYISNLKAFVDSIAVSWMGTDAASIRYNMGKYHSAYENSIFGPTEEFSEEIGKIDGGIVQSVYNDIKDIEGEGFQNLMNKPIEEIESWEVVALAWLYEDCIDENGNIDWEKLETLINHCYLIETETTFAGPNVGNYTEVDIKLSPAMSLLNDYLSTQSFQLANAYENNDMRLTYDIRYYEVQAKCYLSDIVYSLSTYYPAEFRNGTCFVLQDDNGTMGTAPINLEVSEDGSVVTLNLFGRENPVTIYSYTDDYTQELYTVNSDVAESELVDPGIELIVDGSRFFVEQTMGFVPGLNKFNTAYGIATGLYGLGESYFDNVENNESIHREMDNQEKLGVMYATGCSASIIQCGDRYDVRNVAFDTTDVICQVSLYNQALSGDYNYNYDGEPIDSYQTVQEEFYQYMNGEKTLEECPTLNALKDFDRGSKLYPEGKYSDYLSEVESMLEANMNVDNVKPRDVHTSELLAVVEGSGSTVVDLAAIEWLDDEKEDAKPK